MWRTVATLGLALASVQATTDPATTTVCKGTGAPGPAECIAGGEWDFTPLSTCVKALFDDGIQYTYGFSLGGDCDCGTSTGCGMMCTTSGTGDCLPVMPKLTPVCTGVSSTGVTLLYTCPAGTKCSMSDSTPAVSTVTVDLTCKPGAKTAWSCPNNQCTNIAPNPMPLKLSLTADCVALGVYTDGCGGGAGGWVFFGLVLGGLFLYCVGGIVFNMVRKERKGVEAVPNLEFWRDLPNLLKDGFRYFVHLNRSMCQKCFGNKGEGEESSLISKD